MRMINSVHGQVWQVRRGDMPDWFYQRRDNGVEPKDVHASEWAWIESDSNFDRIVPNDGSLEELLVKIQKIHKKKVDSKSSWCYSVCIVRNKELIDV